jgi:hypothetical protein
MLLEQKPESPCTIEGCRRPPLPGGRIDLNALLSGYIDSGIFLVWKPSQAVVGSEKREFEEKKF